MFCGKCGQLNSDRDEFCVKCGKGIKSSEEDSGQDTSRLKQVFPGLSPRFYEHPDERKTLKAMQGIPLTGEVMKQFFKYWHNINYEVSLTAGSVRITESHFSQTYEIFKECGDILDLKKLPKFYVSHDSRAHACTTGVDDTFLVVSSALLDLMTRDELYFIIGHEMGHIKSNHILYHDLASWIKHIATVAGNLTFGIGEIVGMGLMTAIINWIKKSEFTADRAGLIACQDVDVATKALIKLALGSKKLFSQISINEYISQGEELKEDEDKSAVFKSVKTIQNITMTHAFTATRVKLLQEWAKSNDYERLLDGDYQGVEQMEEPEDIEEKEELECPLCSAGISPDDNVCKLCGNTIFKTPPICPECFRDLKPNMEKCPNCDKSFRPSKARLWVYSKVKDAKSFVGDNIKKINLFKKGKEE
jgi:Zn-dependent protease with chaperone function